MTEEKAGAREPWLVALQDLHASRGRPTLRWLGDRSDMSYQTVNDYLRGNRKPPLDKLLRLVRALGGDETVIGDLYQGARREPPSATPTDRELLADILVELRAIRALMERDAKAPREAQ